MPQVIVETTTTVPDPESSTLPRQDVTTGPSLGDSHFQVPIRRLGVRLSDIGEVTEPDQNEPFEEVDIASSDASTTGSWQDIATPHAEMSDDGDTTPRPEENKSDEDRPENSPGPTPADYAEYYEAIIRGDVEIVKAKLDLGVRIERENDDGLNALVLSIIESRIDMMKMLLERGADVRWRVKSLPPVMHAIMRHEKAPQIIQLLVDHGANLNTTIGTERFNTLHFAAAAGMVDAVDFLISKDMDLNATCSKGRTPLILAAENGCITVAKILLAKGAELHKRSQNGGTALTWAACNGHLETVKYLLAEGIEIDDCDDCGLTALSVASNLGHLEVVELLIEKGADVNMLSREPKDFTPAMAAAIAGHTKVLQTLIRHGSDLNILNGNGETILDATMAAGHVDALKVLLEALGGSEYPRDSVALQMAASGSYAMIKPLVATVSLMYPHIDSKNKPPGDLAWIDWVLEKGGDLVKPYAMLMLLDAAFHEENVDMVEALLRHGCDPNRHFSTGHTPLSIAIARRNIDLVRVLLAANADPAIPAHDPEGINLTPFHQAIFALEDDREKDTSIVDLLLASRRCEIMEGDRISSTVFDYAIRQIDHWDNGLAEVLIFRMLESIPDVNDDRCGNGSTLMHAAVCHERKDLVDILLQKGADINATDDTGLTPFLLTCVRNAKFLPHLVERGTDPSIPNRDGQGALHVAAENGNIEGLEYLLALGLNIDVVDNGGHTPLLAALAGRQQDAALYLIDRGASTSVTTILKGRTVLHYAASFCMKRVIEKLLDNKTVDINAKDSTGWTSLALACKLAPPPVITALLSRGADPEISNDTTDRPLHIALSLGNEDAATVLINHGADLSARGFMKRTPLQLAAAHDNARAVRLLLAKGVSADEVDDKDQTSLFVCQSSNITQILIDHGADINHCDSDGCTPIHEAVKCDSLETFRALFKNGADMDARTNDGLNVHERIKNIADDWAQQDYLYAIEQVGAEMRMKLRIEKEVAHGLI